MPLSLARTLLCVSMRGAAYLSPMQRLEERETQRLEKLQRQIDLPQAYQESLARQAERREREERVRKMKLEKTMQTEQVCMCVVCVHINGL